MVTEITKEKQGYTKHQIQDSVAFGKATQTASKVLTIFYFLNSAGYMAVNFIHYT